MKKKINNQHVMSCPILIEIIYLSHLTHQINNLFLDKVNPLLPYQG